MNESAVISQNPGFGSFDELSGIGIDSYMF
jgi:hypothetical protein